MGTKKQDLIRRSFLLTPLVDEVLQKVMKERGLKDLAEALHYVVIEFKNKNHENK